MKKIILNLAFALSTTVALFANPPIKIGKMTIDVKPQIAQQAFVVSLKNVNFEPTKIEIRNENEVLVWSEKIKNKADFATRFVLKNLPKGNYELKVSNRLNEATMPFELNKQEVIFKNEKFTTYSEPTVFYAKDSLTVDFSNYNGDEVKMRIKNSVNDVVFEENIKTRDHVRRYDVAKLVKGDYKVEVIAKNSVFATHFEK